MAAVTPLKTLFISAYRNFSIRYILHSDILETILEADIRVVLFVKDNDIDYYRERFASEKVIIEPVLFDDAMSLLKGNLLNHLFVLVRKCMSGGSADIQNTTDTVRVFQYEQHMSNTLAGRILFAPVKVAAALGRRFKYIRCALVKLEGRLFSGRMYDPYFEKYHPKALLVSSLGYMIDPYIMRAAKRKGCRTISIIHSWDNPTTKDYRGGVPDHVIAWNEIMKKEVNIFHDIPAQKIYTGGIAHWDFYFDKSFKAVSREAFCEKYGIPKEKKILFYGTSSPIAFQNSFDVMETILAHIASGRIREDAVLLVRLHPAYLSSRDKRYGGIREKYFLRMKAIRQRFPGLVYFNLPQVVFLTDDYDMPVRDMYDLANMLSHSAVLITEYSTLMIEAAIFDLPVVNAAMHYFRDTDKPASYFENYTHLARILKTGACRNAYSYDELLEWINQYLAAPETDAGKRKRLVEQEITTNPGCAGRAIGAHIRDVLEREEQ